nr:uncharacterized protein LOC102457303 isoform X2 [Pelodiscus sinensis]|eukprot:XP_014425819.1 uncharacterized protein LOC102457303 isoform X2 [Pelodiscus sinensis]
MNAGFFVLLSLSLFFFSSSDRLQGLHGRWHVLHQGVRPPLWHGWHDIRQQMRLLQGRQEKSGKHWTAAHWEMLNAPPG